MLSFSLTDYDYDLPPELIAQRPAANRDASRLLVLDRSRGTLADRNFPALLQLLSAGDLLVFNDTRVFPARLLGRKESGGRIELLLLEYPQPLAESDFTAWGLLKSSKGPRLDQRLLFGDELQAKVAEVGEGGKVRVILRCGGEGLDACLGRHGRMPLPPYIRRGEAETAADRRRYQTVYAAVTGAVAAPTAGLHFTRELLAAIAAKGVGLARITLHVGYGTFAPVRAEDIREHAIHAEHFAISEENAGLVNRTRAAGGRIWAVGTTSVRALEAAADPGGLVRPGGGWCRLYIYPGYRFRVVDNLLTNFHLPKSSLLFLVSALAGRERIMAAYAHAVAQRYRFFSYGDAMAIIG
ncbi:tRNA preQ1(34) S-adenosylmethionine ribosyltransferase-isomerase QueA [Desulfurivibrio sp. D14AmB]|uniref:tRNA preQ1(34) S-adenosylmethionine ribosyltransferase-isomerase QueA n=1 Tax=Desulfurivibrio sp. D14AmB TaxID=3374370 RepID=UPI00376EC89A